MASTEASFITPTLGTMPSTRSILPELKVPTSIIVQPLAPSAPLPVINFHSDDLIRCSMCKGYINLYCRFTGDGNHWICNLCETPNKVPENYYAPLDGSSRPIDIAKKPELTVADFELIAPEGYMVRPPMPCTYVFILDISRCSKDSNFKDTVLGTIKALVEQQAFFGLPRTQIGIIGFDSQVHYVAMDVSYSYPKIFTIGESPEGVFLPVPKSHLLVNLEESFNNVVAAIDALGSYNGDAQGLAIHHAIRAAYCLMKDTGGKAMLFLSESSPLEAKKDKVVKMTPSIEFYRAQAIEFCNVNICCDVYVASTQYCNLISICEVSRHTGGEVYFYPYFNKSRFETKLYHEIWMNITNPTAWETAFKLRLSKAWRSTHVYGHCHIKTGDMITVSCLNSSSALTYDIELISDDAYVMYVQSALLYSSSDGERKIRVMNYMLPMKNDLREIYTNTNWFAVINALGKRAVQRMVINNSIMSGWDYLESQGKEIVNSVLKTLGNLPDFVQYFPVYLLGLMKHDVFNQTRVGCNI